jgi:hypothetical protein
MQLGARWRGGDPPHRSVPPALHATIAAQQAEHPEASSWTLTWLEGRPRCALEHAVIVTLDAAGRPLVLDGADPASDRASASEDDEDEDDDWLL